MPGGELTGEFLTFGPLCSYLTQQEFFFPMTSRWFFQIAARMLSTCIIKSEAADSQSQQMTMVKVFSSSSRRHEKKKAEDDSTSFRSIAAARSKSQTQKSASGLGTPPALLLQEVMR